VRHENDTLPIRQEHEAPTAGSIDHSFVVWRIFVFRGWVQEAGRAGGDAGRIASERFSGRRGRSNNYHKCGI
jgi:hypothetical protein